MTETQTRRVGTDAVIADRGRGGGTPPPRRRPQGSRERPVRPARRGLPLPRVRFVTGLALIVALAMATVGIQAYVRAGHQQSRITALQGELGRLQHRIEADEVRAAGDRRHVRSVAAQAESARRAVARVSWALQSVPSQAQVAGVRNQLADYAACIPQLQREVAGLHLSWTLDPAKPSNDNLRLSTTAPISASCRSALTGR